MSASTIYHSLCVAGMSPVGACAMLGNMQAEGEMRGNNAQNGMANDEAYTAGVDNGSISRAQFKNDGIGYGLCQWTWNTRKEGLYDFAKRLGVSISDENMQTQYAVRELQNEFNALWQYLRKTDDIDEATDRICAEFERPAANNFLTRRDHAKRYYAELVDGAFDPTDMQTDTDGTPSYDLDEGTKLIYNRVLQSVLVGFGYDADSNLELAIADFARDVAAGKWGRI